MKKFFIILILLISVGITQSFAGSWGYDISGVMNEAHDFSIYVENGPVTSMQVELFEGTRPFTYPGSFGANIQCLVLK